MKNENKLENDGNFISLLSNTVFMYLYDDEKVRPIINKIVKQVANINLDEYKLDYELLDSDDDIEEYFMTNIPFKKAHRKYIFVDLNAQTPSNQIGNYLYLLDTSGDEYGQNDSELIQISFNNANFPNLRNQTISQLLFKQQQLNIRFSSPVIYEIFTKKCLDDLKSGDKSMKYLAIFAAQSFDEMKDIAGDDVELKKIVEKVLELSKNEKFINTYKKEEKWKEYLRGERKYYD